jgi:uncharacterized phosphosugar-binding protein
MELVNAEKERPNTVMLVVISTGQNPVPVLAAGTGLVTEMLLMARPA